MQTVRTRNLISLGSTLLFCLPGAAPGAETARPANPRLVTECTLRFDMTSWSEADQRAKGSGVISCNNGQTLAVTVEASGPGVTAGSSRFHDATGDFSEASDISGLLGVYGGVAPGARAAAEVNVITKGDDSLALAGVPAGWRLGVTAGQLAIQRMKRA